MTHTVADLQRSDLQSARSDRYLEAFKAIRDEINGCRESKTLNAIIGKMVACLEPRFFQDYWLYTCNKCRRYTPQTYAVGKHGEYYVCRSCLDDHLARGDVYRWSDGSYMFEPETAA